MINLASKRLPWKSFFQNIQRLLSICNCNCNTCSYLESSIRFLDATGSYGLRLIPLHPTLSAYKAVITQTTLYTPFLVSIYITIVGTLIGLFLTTLRAYVLIQDDMPGRKLFASILFFTMLFNGGLVPTYLNMKNLGLMNSLWSIILPLSLQVYNLILMKSFFEGIPKALMESAEIDGCTPMGIFLKIVLPLIKTSTCCHRIIFRCFLLE